MFQISVEREFCAAHALVIAGEREATHGHNWRLTVTLAGEELDADGLLVDFHALERLIDDIIGPFKNQDLNVLPVFSHLNPSAELVAKHIGDAVMRGLARSNVGGTSGRPVHLESVWITEAPGCKACYRPATSPSHAPGPPSTDPRRGERR